ncbi:MAG: hypothetical protein JXB32_06225 [Deltaproteobacteria bacterium]|nr:hypothetical protein [Deltaproteobacteria bacterium]
MLARIITPLVLVAALAAPAAADAVLVPGGSVVAGAAVSAGGSMAASISLGAGVTAAAVPAASLRASPYAAPAVSAVPTVTIAPVSVESAPPVIRIRPREERPAVRVVQPSPPAPVVVPAVPVAEPTGTLRLRTSYGVRPIQLAQHPTRMIVEYARPSAPPPTVVVTAAPVVATTVSAVPACGCCNCYDGASAMPATEGPSDDDFDLMLFGNYRYLTDGSQVGGASLALRLLLTDELSLEAGLGYLAGGSVDGRGREEIPTSLNVLWYVAGRDFPLYLGLGVVADWTNVWVDADCDGLDGNADLFRLGARAAVGLEWALFDTFVLTAEAETFVREAVSGATCDAGPGTPSCTEVGLAANVGFGLRF